MQFAPSVIAARVILWQTSERRGRKITRPAVKSAPRAPRKSNKSLINIKSENLIKNDKISKCSADNCRAGEEKTRKKWRATRKLTACKLCNGQSAEFFDLISRARKIASAAVWRANKRSAGDVTEHAFHCFWSFSKFQMYQHSCRSYLFGVLSRGQFHAFEKTEKNGNYYKATGNRSLLLFSTLFSARQCVAL
jgi:hypothetical protein